MLICRLATGAPCQVKATGRVSTPAVQGLAWATSSSGNPTRTSAIRWIRGTGLDQRLGGAGVALGKAGIGQAAGAVDVGEGVETLVGEVFLELLRVVDIEPGDDVGAHAEIPFFRCC